MRKSAPSPFYDVSAGGLCSCVDSNPRKYQHEYEIAITYAYANVCSCSRFYFY